LSEKKGSQNNSIIADTSVLIEYLEDTELGRKFFDQVLSNPQIEKYFIAPIVDTELKYILCRKTSYDEAVKSVNKFLKDFILYPEENLRDEAAKLKCNFAISLAVCYSIATAIVLDGPLYIKRQREIEKILDELTEIVDLNFINDL